ncbi:hypothetical protein [Rossellomorea marisflavi]|uniref:hypothetical protein n=1 Tax=Rossellomorea marisflavi TaxID=189381 RepID=UPI003F9F6274
MNTKMKKTTLMALSTLALGSGLIPAMGTTQVSAQATKQSNTVAPITTSEMLARMNVAVRYNNLELFKLLKQDSNALLPGLKASEQVRFKQDILFKENAVTFGYLEEKHRQYMANTEMLTAKEVASFNKELDAYPVNGQGFKDVQKMKTIFGYKVAETEYLSMRYLRPLSPSEVSTLGKLANSVDPGLRKSTVMEFNRNKDGQEVVRIKNGIRFAESFPDKTLIAKIKADTNKLSDETIKRSLVSSIQKIEKKQRVISSSALSEGLTRMVYSGRLSRYEVPVYVQDIVAKKLTSYKVTNTAEYLRTAKMFYGKEVENYAEYARRYSKEGATLDRVAIFKSKANAFEKQTGIKGDRDIMRMEMMLQESVNRHQMYRLKLADYLTKTETDATIKLGYDSNKSKGDEVQKRVDESKAKKAKPYIDQYRNFGRKSTDYKRALDKVNEIKTESIKTSILKVLNQ